MTDDTSTATHRRRRIMDAFDAVLDLSPRERAAWLGSRFGDDPAMISAVEALVAADASPTILPTTLHPTLELLPPERVGVYRLDTRLGTGGMGEVWQAERDDGLFDHRVAVKLMRPSLASPELESFFDSERRLLARMRHPNIARIFDGGMTEAGVPWFAMDLIDGVPVDEWAATLPVRNTAREEIAERVALAIAVCGAVQHAHQNLIVHADLKPQNILVEASGVPRLVDFGIAHLLAAADDPAIDHAYPRTPSYASPERLSGGQPSISDDIYALGTVIHGLLSGDWPAKGETPRVAPSACAAEPRRAQVLRGDLDAIVARARAAHAESRYPTAQALAEDLRAWSEMRPVSARAGGWRYQARRFVRRNRWPVAAAAAAVLAMIATTVIVTTLYFRAESARRDAEERFGEVRALAKYMLVDFHDALEPLPGASPLRARTAEVGRSYLERLSRHAGADVDLNKELAVGYGRVGHSMAVSATNGTAGLEEGDRALAKAVTILTPLVAEHPERSDLKVELARVLSWRSSVVAFARSDPKTAHRMLDQAFALDDGVLSQTPNDIDAAYGRWLAVLARLDIWAMDNRHADIIALATEQLKRAKPLPTSNAYVGLRPLMEAALYNARGDALSYLDKPREALPDYQRAFDILAPIGSRATADVRVRTRLIAYAYALSWTYEELKDRKTALAWAQRGVDDARELMRFESSPAAQSAANLVLLYHATLLVESGPPDEAVAEARATVEQRGRQSAADPTNDDIRASYLFALKPLMEILSMADRREEACTVAREASAGWRQMARERPLAPRRADDARLMLDRAKKCVVQTEQTERS